MQVRQPQQGMFSGLESLKGRKDPEAIKQVAKEMESLFAYEMIKAMRETVGKDDNGLGGDTYSTLFDLEIARLMSERGLGLKEALLKGMERRMSPSQKTTGKPQTAAASASAPVSAIPQKPAAAEPIKKPVASDGSRFHHHGAGSMPVEGEVSSRFGMRKHPVHGDRRFHGGVDIAAPEGTAVTPLRSGKVVFSGTKPGYGNMVVVDHGDGVTSTYAHTRKNLVVEGDRVNPSTVIAEVGSTGMSTGPHLHFEVSEAGKRVDPMAMVVRK